MCSDLKYALIGCALLAVCAMNLVLYYPLLTGAANKDAPLFETAAERHVVLDSQQVDISSETSIIGIRVNGKARAYLIPALAGISDHVFNDLIDQTPITVSYCDIDDYARVFTQAQSGKPLDVKVVGRVGQMMCMVDGVMFGQKTQDAPLSDFPFLRTTWKEWTEEHPDSTVYVGKLAEEVRDPAAG